MNWPEQVNVCINILLWNEYAEFCKNKEQNKMKGKIAYRFETPVYPGNILYVNLIERYNCLNDCLFCSRPRTKKEIGKSNIYEKKAETFLYLPKAPSKDDIIKAVDQEIRRNDEELAIIGLGEPLMYLPKVVEVIRKVKENHDIKTRIDTNGLVKCIYKNPAHELKQAGLDEIRISVNAINEEDYKKLCRPKFKNAFPNLISFIKDCLEEKIDTYASFVINFEDTLDKKIKSREPEEYLEFAKSLGIKKKNIILREYVPPLT